MIIDLPSQKFKDPDLQNQKSQFVEKASNIDSSSDGDKTHSARKRTINPNETDLCSDVSRLDENSKHSLLHFDGIDWICCSCGKGEKVLWPCR